MIYLQDSLEKCVFDVFDDGESLEFLGRREIDTVEARKKILALMEKCKKILAVIDEVEKK